MQIIWLRLGIPLVYNIYRFTLYDKYRKKYFLHGIRAFRSEPHVKKMASRTERSNSQVTSRPEAVHSGSTSAIGGLYKMFQQSFQPAETTTGTASTTSVAQKGNFSHALNVRQESYTTWTVDSGASVIIFVKREGRSPFLFIE